MKYLIFVAGLTVLGCFGNQNEIAENNNFEIDYPRLIFGENWEKQFPNEDSILRFNYDDSYHSNGSLISIFIPMSQRKAYLFRTYKDENVKDRTQIIESIETNNPFTGHKEIIHFTQKDTFGLEEVKWQRLLTFLSTFPISEYSRHYKNTKVEANPNASYLSFEMVKNDDKSQLIRQDGAMENDFQAMYSLLLDALGFVDFRNKEEFMLKKSPLNAFNNLTGSSWVIDTTWANGERFHQRQIYEWRLGQELIKVKTFSETAPQIDENGMKAAGIRGFNSSNDTLYFYEIDITGAITKGTCTIENQNIYYEYDYGDYKMKDKWLYVDKNTYQYIIEGEKEDAIQVFMNAFVRRVD